MALRLAPRFADKAANQLLAGGSTAATQRNTYFTYSNQISQPLERQPKYTTAEEAVKVIKSGKSQLNQMQEGTLSRLVCVSMEAVTRTR